MHLEWKKCRGGVPCSFFRLNLNSISARQGVYVIWLEEEQGESPRVVRVGQVWSENRSFKDRFEEHREDEMINDYTFLGDMYVTWADVLHRENLNGIERFLFNSLQPWIGERAPDVPPIPVNLPPWLLSPRGNSHDKVRKSNSGYHRRTLRS